MGRGAILAWFGRLIPETGISWLADPDMAPFSGMMKVSIHNMQGVGPMSARECASEAWHGFQGGGGGGLFPFPGGDVGPPGVRPKANQAPRRISSGLP